MTLIQRMTECEGVIGIPYSLIFSFGVYKLYYMALKKNLNSL